MMTNRQTMGHMSGGMLIWLWRHRASQPMNTFGGGPKTAAAYCNIKELKLLNKLNLFHTELIEP